MSDGSVDVSVLVTTYRRPRHLALALESLALQQDAGVTMEVIVSDDGSDDETPQVVRSFATNAPFPVRFTTQAHDGFRLARVRNEAARLANGEYLLFLDGDCIVPRHHVAAHANRRRLGTALLGYCARLPVEANRILAPENLASTNLAALVPASERRALARRRRKAWWHAVSRHPTKPRLAGGDFGVWRADFERVNGFDERFVGWGQEDDDLGLRLRAAGVRLETILGLTHSLHVWHETDATATPRWRDGANIRYFERHGRLTACRQGMVVRPAAAVIWGLPADLMTTPLGRLIASRLAGATFAPEGKPCEIELVVRPGTGRFTRRSECRLALVASDQHTEGAFAHDPDMIAVIDGGEALDATLATVG